MKKVDFNKLQAGDLVEVPRTQFAPMRSGWNGWLFSEAEATFGDSLPTLVDQIRKVR